MLPAAVPRSLAASYLANRRPQTGPNPGFGHHCTTLLISSLLHQQSLDHGAGAKSRPTTTTVNIPIPSAQASSREMADGTERKVQVVPAPARPELKGKCSLFLAGTTTRTTGPDWRQVLIDAIAGLPVTVFNPLRPDWDSSWREDPEFVPFREQVEWELDMQERADVIVVYYGPHTDAPISLLELGLCARSGKAIVACHRDYKKRGNVLIVSQRLGIQLLDTEDDFVGAVLKRLSKLLNGEAQDK